MVEDAYVNHIPVLTGGVGRLVDPGSERGTRRAARYNPVARPSVTDVICTLSTAVYTNLSIDRTEAALSIVSEFASDRAVAARVTAEVTQSGLPVTSVEDPIRLFPGETSVVQSCEILRVQLWWPNGHGSQPLYQLRLTLAAEDGGVLDQRTLEFGVRHVDAAPCEGAPGDPLPFALQVNGERIWIKGWDWSPADCDLEPFLSLACDAHVNLLRVRDGGRIESEAFYRLCDRFGIMVWQEFPRFSDLPETQDADAIRGEAEALLALRRHHPSLVMWSVGADLRPAVLSELQAAVETEDPQRLWVPPGARGRRRGITEVEVAEAFGALDPADRTRASELLQALDLQSWIEAIRSLGGQYPGVLPGLFNATSPEPGSPSAVDYDGRPKLAYDAVKRAYAPLHVGAASSTAYWQGETEFRAEVQLQNDGAERSLLNVVASIVDLEGRELYQENLAAEAPEHGVEIVDTLSWRFPPGFEDAFLLFLEVIDEEGETIARNHYFHSRAPAPAFGAFLDGRAATLIARRSR